MRKIILSQHVSLDGFVAGPNGEMNWIKLDDTLFDLVGRFTENADTALYGRVTWQMMEAYWPNAADKPNPSKHDIEHSVWYNKVTKVVLSKTMDSKTIDKTIFISENIGEAIQQLKLQEGKDILIFGSPTAVHSLMAENLIDEYWLFINPVILGNGITAFTTIAEKINLKLESSQSFSCGVTGLHYSVIR